MNKSRFLLIALMEGVYTWVIQDTKRAMLPVAETDFTKRIRNNSINSESR